jgi:hypothetical protein
LEIIDADDDEKKEINLNALEDLIECDTELKLNDPLLSFPLFDTPPSSSHSNSIPSSPSSISTESSSSSTNNSSNNNNKNNKRTRSNKNHHDDHHQFNQSLSFEINPSSDDDDDDDDFDFGNEKRRHKKRSKNYSSASSIVSNASSSTSERSNALSLKDPMMMSASHSPSHFSSDLSSYMDQMFFSSSQFLSPCLAADDSIDLCSILKTENSLGYDNDMIMIG